MENGKESQKKPAITRRSFLDFFLKGGLVVWMGAMLAPVVAYILPVQAGGIKKSTLFAGAVKDFPVGTAKMMQSEGKPIMIIRVAEGRFKAYSAICTHLGCIVKWDSSSKDIKCPCHAAVFSADGKVVSGPPPRPLPEYEVIVAGGEAMLKL